MSNSLTVTTEAPSAHHGVAPVAFGLLNFVTTPCLPGRLVAARRLWGSARPSGRW